jgi:hypothetical protein
MKIGSPCAHIENDFPSEAQRMAPDWQDPAGGVGGTCATDVRVPKEDGTLEEDGEAEAEAEADTEAEEEADTDALDIGTALLVMDEGVIEELEVPAVLVEPIEVELGDPEPPGDPSPKNGASALHLYPLPDTSPRTFEPGRGKLTASPPIVVHWPGPSTLAMKSRGKSSKADRGTRLGDRSRGCSRFEDPSLMVTWAQFMYISRLPILLNHVHVKRAFPEGASLGIWKLYFFWIGQSPSMERMTRKVFALS